ncbi:M13 family metallopeptidase [Brooklawnia cerclae]|uniref:Endopeptidase n=1 Tax=Brooklawnia cerclae TaxID=349934 RepID=A0ABX0SCP7_9ACTN|nr:putative endopeptidase [Brooklawnia cerclae]
MTTDALNLAYFDQSTRSQDDLFGHVNGAWARQATIPDDKSSWGAFHELREKSEQAVREIVDELTPGTGDGDEARIANLYASFMDTDRVESLGADPLRPLLDRVDAIGSTTDLARFWGWSVRHGITALLDLDNDADPGNPGRYLVFVGQSGIGLPDEEYYRLDEHAEIREAYVAHIAKALAAAGVADADDQARRAFDLETRIAAHHWDKVRTRDMVEMYFPQTWEEFAASSPSLDWDAFLAGAELPASAVAEVVNCQRTFLGDAQALVTASNLDDWKAWARWQVVDALAPYLSSDIVEENFDFYGRTLQGIPVLRERWKRGVSLVEGVLGEAVGRVYVERHFPEPTKARADELVTNLLEAYRRSISELDWMTDETRAEALLKLSKLRPKIGYPAKWRDYSRLQLVPDDLVGNVLRADSFAFDYMIEQLAGPIDPDEWLMYPQTVNAYYHPLRNEIVFPAAILQPPFFDAEADDAVNYGGIGAVIGHEIGHAFDDQGSTCDGDGRLRNWWTDADRKAFEERTASLVAQYNQLAPSVTPEVHVNGELTLGENIGDLGGLAIAYQAWRIATHDADPQPVDGMAPAQRLFYGWAQTWRTITRPQAMKERLATDPHSPDEIRCNQVARNIPEFHEAFGTAPTDAMWLEPAERVRIW